MQCNRHVVKMVLETAQLLSACFPPGALRFKHTHFNHPCAKWARESVTNYKWLLLHGLALADEYTKRYGKVHGAADVIEACLEMCVVLPVGGLTPFARAIKEPWKSQTAHLSIVEAYRAYYIGDKSRFARWAPRAKAPAWWPNKEA